MDVTMHTIMSNYGELDRMGAQAHARAEQAIAEKRELEAKLAETERRLAELEARTTKARLVPKEQAS